MSVSSLMPSCTSTGIAGLDDILNGGLPANRMYLIEGKPGTGKTTIALQFLLEGVRRQEPVLYITLSETEEELGAVARSHGWDLAGFSIYDLAAPANEPVAESQYTIFHPSEIELGEITKSIFDKIERVKPRRVVFDSLSEMRLLARDPLRYRRQILAIKQFFIGRESTVILLDDLVAKDSDSQIESLAHGVLTLEYNAPGYGAPRRQLRVLKLRGVKFAGGYHDFSIETGGIKIYPRLVAKDHQKTFTQEALLSGVDGFDALTGGGLDVGTSTLIMGPAGVGKSTVVATYAIRAVERGKKVAYYSFDENLVTFFARTTALGFDFQRHIEAGSMTVRQVDPAELSPGEFSYLVCQAVEQEGKSLIIIDSLNGYYQAMPEAQFLNAYLHELLAYLALQGVTTLIVMAQHGLVGTGMSSPVDVSYLADTVLLMRYFEAAGEIRQAISVIKKRSSGHERAIREFRIDSTGIQVGQPLREFRGVLSGLPEYFGDKGPLLKERNESSNGEPTR